MTQQNKVYAWTIKVEIDPAWVADGFDLTEERAKAMFMNELPYAHGSEIKVKMIGSPSPEAIRKEQGYDDNSN